MNFKEHVKSDSPCRIIQFGEGNFLRAFADHLFCLADRSGSFKTTVRIIKPIPQGSVAAFEAQNCIYNVSEQGPSDTPATSPITLIDNIDGIVDPYEDFGRYLETADLPDLRFVVSNTTEAGITYLQEVISSDHIASSFPAKVVQLLFRRFKTFGGDPSKGLIFLPCELIDNNGSNLREIVLRHIEEGDYDSEFSKWVTGSCEFCNTLVDRIVIGRPSDPSAYYDVLGYSDELLTVCEPFLLWVIASEKNIGSELKIGEQGKDVVFTDDIRPYRERKVRILNGVHTCITPASLLAGYQYVHEAVNDDLIKRYIAGLINSEIVPSIRLSHEDLIIYADSVLERFRNPSLNHRLVSISLNTVSKWTARVLPSLTDRIKTEHQLPERIVFSFAAMFVFYVNGSTCRDRFFNASAFPDIGISDTEEVRDFFSSAAERKYSDASYDLQDLLTDFCSNTSFWGTDLLEIKGFVEMSMKFAGKIISYGTYSVLKELLS